MLQARVVVQWQLVNGRTVIVLKFMQKHFLVALGVANSRDAGLRPARMLLVLEALCVVSCQYLASAGQRHGRVLVLCDESRLSELRSVAGLVLGFLEWDLL